MTRFKDSPFEKKMVQAPQGERDTLPSSPKEKKEKAHGKKDHYRNLFITPKERSAKQ